jgi:type IX secretion system PorP/SprF family membrane protein
VHSYFTAGKKFTAGPDLTVTPSTMVRFVPESPLSMDLNVKFDYSSSYWAGLSLRTVEAFNVFAGVNIKRKFDITYAFEWNVNRLSSYQSGTHELIFGLRLQHPNVVVSPDRFW